MQKKKRNPGKLLLLTLDIYLMLLGLVHSRHTTFMEIGIIQHYVRALKWPRKVIIFVSFIPKELDAWKNRGVCYLRKFQFKAWYVQILVQIKKH